MFSPDQLNSLSKIILEKLGVNDTRNYNFDKFHKNNSDKSVMKLTPTQTMIIIGVITNAIEVHSALVDRNQAVQALISGSLKKKTELEKTIEAIGKLPFEEVLKAVINNLS